MPERHLKQAEFRAVALATKDADSYQRFKAGKYLTAAQKVSSGALAAGIAATLAVFIPINQLASPEDASILLLASLATGAAAGTWIRFRARQTGKDQED